MQIFEDMPGLQVTPTSVSMGYNIIEASDILTGPYDETVVKPALLNYAPVSKAPPSATYAWPRRGLDLNEIGPGVWKAKITWAALNMQYAVKISGKQETIRQSKTTVNTYGAAPPDTKGVIGWDGRTVHGVSIYVPTRSWTETVEIPIAQYTFDYEDNVAFLQGRPVNLEPFRGYSYGEVRFSGMSAQLSTQNPDFVQATFEFEQSPSFTVAGHNPITIGDITNITKYGWDYLWVYYEPVVDATANVVIPKPKNVFVERVYDYGSFSILNIGTGKSLPMWQGPVSP